MLHRLPARQPGSQDRADRARVAAPVLYIYNVVSDRITPYTSQATVDTLLVQIAPEVTGQVEHVGVTDNGAVKKGQVLFRIDPPTVRDRAAAGQGRSRGRPSRRPGCRTVEIGVAQATLQKQRVDLAASRQLGKIVIDLVAKGALAETNAIRARADIAKTRSRCRRAARRKSSGRGANLGAAGDRERRRCGRQWPRSSRRGWT